MRYKQMWTRLAKMLIDEKAALECMSEYALRENDYIGMNTFNISIREIDNAIKAMKKIEREEIDYDQVRKNQNLWLGRGNKRNEESP